MPDSDAGDSPVAHDNRLADLEEEEEAADDARASAHPPSADAAEAAAAAPVASVPAAAVAAPAPAAEGAAPAAEPPAPATPPPLAERLFGPRVPRLVRALASDWRPRLIVGALLATTDAYTDVGMIWSWWHEGHALWAALGLLFVLLPTVVVSAAGLLVKIAEAFAACCDQLLGCCDAICACIAMCNGKAAERPKRAPREEEVPFSPVAFALFAALQLGVLYMAAVHVYYGVEPRANRFLNLARLCEVVLEAVPQTCLQTYALLQRAPPPPGAPTSLADALAWPSLLASLGGMAAALSNIPQYAPWERRHVVAYAVPAMALRAAAVSLTACAFSWWVLAPTMLLPAAHWLWLRSGEPGADVISAVLAALIPVPLPGAWQRRSPVSALSPALELALSYAAVTAPTAWLRRQRGATRLLVARCALAPTGCLVYAALLWWLRARQAHEAREAEARAKREADATALEQEHARKRGAARRPPPSLRMARTTDGVPHPYTSELMEGGGSGDDSDGDGGHTAAASPPAPAPLGSTSRGGRGAATAPPRAASGGSPTAPGGRSPACSRAAVTRPKASAGATASAVPHANGANGAARGQRDAAIAPKVGGMGLPSAGGQLPEPAGAQGSLHDHDRRDGLHGSGPRSEADAAGARRASLPLPRQPRLSAQVVSNDDEAHEA